MDPTYVSRVTVLAVAVENYRYLKRLNGPSIDIRKMKQLLVESEDTAIYELDQFIELQNPAAEDLRSAINSYVINRPARGDILLFYFSGHGVPIGHNDFGFCTIDTYIHPEENSVLPLSVVKFSDILSSLSILGITPVIIVDACYSGIAGRTLTISSHDVITTIRQELEGFVASNYSLLCSCREREISYDNSSGGEFTTLLCDTLSQGIPIKKAELSLIDLFPTLQLNLEASFGESIPQLFVGDTLPDFPLIKNVQFKSQTYRLVGHLKKVLIALWNNGEEVELNPSEIRNICGNGAYGNHNKLSFEPWNLVENNPDTKKRRLTPRGRLFVQGNLPVPKQVEKDPTSGFWIASADTELITIDAI
jgi:hypothetical protein